MRDMETDRNLIERLPETASTNTYLKQLCRDRILPEGYTVYTDRQTAGRGQRGNSWESEPGMNITMTLLLRPVHIPIREQFRISQVVALGVTDILGRETDGFSIKWPNDIYWHDKKIAGILIENTLSGTEYSEAIVGIGLNVNQRQFVSDAPNPVSLRQITGHDYDLGALLRQLVEAIHIRYEQSKSPAHTLHAEYMERLYRRDGFYRYSTPGGEIFEARVAAIEPDGFLCLEKRTGEMSRFAFKEVSFLL